MQLEVSLEVMKVIQIEVMKLSGETDPSYYELVSSPDSLFVFGWGGSLVNRANIFVPALKCRSQVLVC